MAPHYKRKRHKLILPVILIVAILLLLAVLIIYLYKNQLTGGDTSSGTVSQSSIISSDPSSALSSDESSDIVESPPPESNAIESSVPTSATTTSIAPPSSQPKQADIPASSNETTSSQENNTVDTTTNGALPAGQLTDWNLILLNPEENNKIDNELDIQKTKFDTQYVDSRAAEAYKNMCSAALKSGSTLYLRSGYRSMKTQQVNYNANVQRQIKAGNSKEEAIRLTNLYYTVPGHSEHHSGLAFDIITPQYHNDIYTLDERFAKTEAYTWLTANCADYGFVLRYPKDKKSITTINFEPWHYRYVGIEHAKYMAENGLCLEEYIGLLKQAER